MRCLFETLVQDVRIALRLARRTRSTTFIVVISTALSVAATGVVFTAIKAVLLKPLPYSRPNELVQLGTRFGGARLSHIDWVFWKDSEEIIRRTRTLESIGVYSNAVFDLGGGAFPPEALYGLRMSPSLFPTLGVSPMLGRNLRPEDDQYGLPNQLILSYGLWARRFNSDRTIVGKNVTIDGHDCVVIGVMGPDFNFPLRRAVARTPQAYVEFWAPMKAGRIRPLSSEDSVGAVARLRPGFSLSQAQEDLRTIGGDLAREFPATNRDRTLAATLLWNSTLGNVRPALWFLMGGATLFLLIGCANVANLLLAGSMARQHEISVRMALGAAQARIIRQLLVESSVPAVMGGLAGYVLTAGLWRILPTLAPVSIPRLAAARADWTILLFALGVALVNGILFGLTPALRFAAFSKASGWGTLGARGAALGGHDKTRGLLVTGEVAVTLVLVLTGGQLLGNFVHLVSIDPGFEADRVLASVILPEFERYKTTEQRAGIYQRFLDAARTIPGVTSAGTVDALPFSGENHGGFLSVSQDAVANPEIQAVGEIDVVGGQYLQTLGARLEAGRWFREEDMNTTSDLVMVNNATAQHFWPRESAIGKRLCINCTPDQPASWKRVIGVVSNMYHADLDGAPGFSVYLAAGALSQAAFLVVQTDRPQGEIIKAIREAIAKVDPNQPVLLTASMRSLLADSIADRQFVVALLSATGGLALLMALAGIYGVMSYTASRRTQEIGVRMAVGATAGRIHALLFRQGFLYVTAGLGIGFAGVALAARALRGVVTGIGSGGVNVMAMAAFLVLLTAGFACWLPARRATKGDPMAALRGD